MSERLDLLKARTASLEILNHRLSGSHGITTGGFHQQEDGSAWYVKHYDLPNQAHAEHLANQIYRSLGHNAPHSQILYHHVPVTLPGLSTTEKRPVYLSKKIVGFRHLQETNGQKGILNSGSFPDAHTAHHYLRGLAADALIGNGDLHDHNVGLVNGKVPTRIDNGDSLNYTGAGGQKSQHEALYENLPHHLIKADFLTHHKAIKKAGLTPEHVTSARFLAPHIKDIVHLRNKHGGWQGFVNRHIPGAEDSVKANFSSILEHRTRKLIDHVVHNFHEYPDQ